MRTEKKPKFVAGNLLKFLARWLQPVQRDGSE